jgi:hypothetical protein
MMDVRPLRWGLVAALLLAARPAAAHGFGQRFDLPLPLQFWVVGAGLTIVFTFVVMALFVREQAATASYPRFDLLRLPPFRLIASPIVVEVIRGLVLAIFLLTIFAGIFGSQDPYANIIVTMIWIIWWVGFAFTCALIGNVWALVNPLDTLFRWLEAGFAAVTGGRALSLNRPYPRWLGTWPAVVFFFSFAWGELVWAEHDVPEALGRAILGYSLISLAGMFVYGRRAWLEQAEAFSVAFGVLARFSPLEARMTQGPASAAMPQKLREWNLRPPGVGLLENERVRWSFVVFVLLMLSTVTFDGFLETPLFQSVFNGIYSNPVLSRLIFDISEWGIPDAVLVKSASLLFFPSVFVLVYALFSWLMALVTRPLLPAGDRSRVTVGLLACSFVLTLVPIAVAYHLSHYFSLLLTAGQFIIPLLSDPFGAGWDLFGTAGYQVNIGFVSPYFFWYAAVTLIVLGHVIAVYIAHVVAMRVFRSRKAALVSQVPMVALMVGYTMVSLWILAQPIVG